jgi:aryl-alcohol dehydrogenase-like predicted oxidoreductase
MQALHDIVKDGHARYIGMSSCWAWQFQLMQRESHITIFDSADWQNTPFKTD